MSASSVTLAQINKWNRQFWSDQHRVLVEAMGDAAIREVAFDTLRLVSDQISIYAAIEKAKRDRVRFILDRSRKGGRAPKKDALQRYIDQLVRRNPLLSAKALEAKLRADAGGDLIDDSGADYIDFTNHDGSSKRAKVTGLKDRLSRAKAEYKSR